MTCGALSDRMWPDERGAAAVEFAFVVIPLCALLMGSLEFGYRVYAQSIVTGVLRDAARMASTGNMTGAQIDTFITDRLHQFNSNSTVLIDRRSYSDFTGVGLPEPITSGSVASGTYCYQDINGNGRWDTDRGRTGLGGPDDIIYYEVQFSYATLLPLSVNMFGQSNTMTLKANTIVSNEPFAMATPTTPPTICN